jgi:anti-sigma factor RsiW
MHAYVDGELDLVKTMQLEAHLQECPICARAYKNHQTLRSAMSSNPLYFKAPNDLSKRVHSALIGADRAQSAEARKMPWWMAWRPSWVAVSIAASLALVAVLVWRLAPAIVGPSPNDLLAQEVLASHIRSLMANHLTDVPSSDQHTVKPWFNGKLDFSPPVQDFSKEGFPLVGGRLDYLEDRPVAALVYQRRKHYINLFVWPSTRDHGQKTIMRQGYNLLCWTRSSMTYWAASDLNNSELQEFAHLVQNRTSPKALR